MKRKLKVTILFSVFIYILLYCSAYPGNQKWTILKRKVLTEPYDFLVIDPSNHNYLYALTSEGLKKTSNFGKKWEKITIGPENMKVHRLIINPFKSNILYACTDNGLFQSTDYGIKWMQKGFEGTSVYAFAFEPNNYDKIKYVITNQGLHFNFDYKTGWQRTAINIDADTIYSIIIYPVENDESFYFGTNKGIYKIALKSDSLVILDKYNTKMKIVDLLINYNYTQIPFAISQSNGVIWFDCFENKWRYLNSGWKKNIPLISTASLTSNNLKRLYVTTKQGEIFAYDFDIPPIALIEFNTMNLSPWEISRISYYLSSELKQSMILKLVNNFQSNIIKSTEYSIDSIITFGKENGYEFIITGRADESDPGKVELKLLITNIFTGKQEKIQTIKSDRCDYYPFLIKKAAKSIRRKINIRENFLKKYVLNTPYRWMWASLLFGSGVIWLCDKAKNEGLKQTEQKPIPTPFP